MKKLRLLPLLLVLVLVFAIPAHANSNVETLDYVTDLSGLLSQNTQAELERMAQNVSQQHQFGVYVLVVPDFRQYASDTFRFSMGIYEQYQLGFGSDKDGVLLMLSMQDRDYELLFHGSRADKAFTEYGRDLMEDRFLEYFRRDAFAAGFQEYIRCCDEYLLAEEAGQPIDEVKSFAIWMLIPGILAAVIAGLVLYAPMQSAKVQHNANLYVAEDGVSLQRQSDLFLHRTVQRRPRQTQSSSGHSSSHHSGSYSGRSGKF